MEDHSNHKDKRVWKRAGLVLFAAALELSTIYGFSHVGETLSTQDQEESPDTALPTSPVIPSTEPSVSETAIPSLSVPDSIPPSYTSSYSETPVYDPAAVSVTESTAESSAENTASSAADTEISTDETEPTAANTDPETPAVCEFVTHGNTDNKEIAFTFDDRGENLAQILDVLDARGIKGTFFLMAEELEKNPGLWQTAIANGHIVLNHTVHHYTDLSERSDETIKKEILGWEDTARTVLGDDYLNRMKTKFPYFRSPGGEKSDRLMRILGELGYTKMIYWSVEDIYFSSHNPDKISMADHYVKDASNGGIFLLHPGDWSYVGDIIDRLQAEGYTFVTVPELFD